MEINGNLNSELNLNKSDIDIFVDKKNLKEYENLKIIGKVKSSFNITLDQILKVTDYSFQAKGSVKTAKIRFKDPKKYNFLKNEIMNLNFENSELN